MARKKLTINFIKRQFIKEGYILLSKEYINNNQKLEYECPNGHKHSISWNNWRLGHRCPHCDVEYRRVDFHKIKKSFEKEGYILLTKEYVNNKQKLDYVCPKGHKHSIKWNDWQRGRRCPYCSGTAKLNIDLIKKEFIDEDYILLVDEYINNSTKLEYICSKGHKHSITWADWVSGHRCPYCAGNKKLTIEFIKSEFESEGYILLSTEYKNAHTKLDYVCPQGHKHCITWGNWKAGYRCPICKSIKHGIKFSGSGHPNWQGGKSFEPYCEVWKDQEYKSDIRIRDGNRCLNPYCSSKNPSDLTIHHIDFNKKNCHPSNLITICRSCNSKANTDRDWHTIWYQIIMNKRYGYNY